MKCNHGLYVSLKPNAFVCAICEIERLTNALVTQTRALDDERRRLLAENTKLQEQLLECNANFLKAVEMNARLLEQQK